MALQSMIGLVCDPVANRVEVPCLGKNVMAASNAIACANMALAGYDPVIPLDEVIETARRVGEQLPRELRCTALGGLSITPTSKLIELKLSACRRREYWILTMQADPSHGATSSGQLPIRGRLHDTVRRIQVVGFLRPRQVPARVPPMHRKDDHLDGHPAGKELIMVRYVEPDKEEHYHCDGPRALPEIRRLTFADKWSEAQALFGKAMVDRWFSKYQPMCDLWLEFPGHEHGQDYRRDLSLDNAIATTTYQVGGVTFRREFFMRAVDLVLRQKNR